MSNNYNWHASDLVGREARNRIIANQNRAIAKSFVTLSKLRDWVHENYHGGAKIGGTTLAQLLDETIKAIAP